MRARDLAEDFPIVDVDGDALDAAREMARRRLPGLIVCTGDRQPYTILPGSQVLRFLMPAYLQDDPQLARALDEEAAADIMGRLTQVVVREVLPRAQESDELPVVDADATTMEVAAVMARRHSPLVAVVEGGKVVGAVTASRLLSALLANEAAE